MQCRADRNADLRQDREKFPPARREAKPMQPELRQRAALHDAALVAVGTGGVSALCIRFELSERLLAWTRPLERYQLDELPIILLFLALALAWFAWRRMREARSALALRRAAEAAVGDALAANRRLVVAGARAQEEERRHLARELHDELGQCINAIKLDAVSIRERSGDPALRADAAAIVGLADRVQRTTQDIVRELRPPGLDELGLVAALESCIEGWRRRMPHVDFGCAWPAHDLPQLGEAVNIAVFRLVQEGLTNVVRHARPRRVGIELACPAPTPAGGGEIVLRVTNDGVAHAGAHGGGETGLGIAGMRERIEALGGRLCAATADRASFVLEARLPLRAAPA
jgi:signal transduction histidine kinase